ncbi:thioredoxin domain-containing protein [bacterium]|nr:thioredoxin domain-containing protein [bacterium]
MRPLDLIRTGVAAAFVALAACSPQGAAPAGGNAAAINPFLEDVVMGDRNAPVAIVEYASTTCSHCRDFWKQVFPVIKERYIDTGKASFVLKDFPTAPAPVAAAGVAIARCAGEAKYYDVMDDLFANQYEILVATQSQGGAIGELLKIGAKHDLSADQVRTCINSEEILDFIAKSQQEAAGKVTGTPTLFIDGELIADHSIDALSKAIDARLGGASGTPAAPTP